MSKLLIKSRLSLINENTFSSEIRGGKCQPNHESCSKDELKCYDKAHVNLTMLSINYSVGRQQPRPASYYFRAERPLFPTYKIKYINVYVWVDSFM